MQRTSIALAVIALGLLGYILLVERGTLSEGELERRKGSVLPELIRDRVSKIEIQRKGVTTVLEKRRDEEEELDTWVVTAPFAAPADEDAIDALLGELEWMDTRRRFAELSAEDRARFGFDAPRYRVWFTVGKERFLVLVGNESPRGDGTYLTVADKPSAFVVGKDLVETLDHEAAHYHTKRLHEGVTRLGTDLIELQDGPVGVRVRRGDDRLWRLEQPVEGLASKQAVEAIIDAVDALRASRFVAKTPAAEHGLAAPSFAIAIESTRPPPVDAGAPKAPQAERDAVRIQVGAACAGHERESYVRAGEDGPVMCALDSDIDKFRKSVSELREARLLPLDPSAVTGITLDAGGRRLELVEQDDGFRYTLRHGGEQRAAGSARAGSVQDWLAALAAQQATEFTGRPPDALPGGAAKLVLERGKTSRPIEVIADTRGSGATGSVLVRRAGEPELVAFPASAAELLEPFAARFRALEVIDRAERELTRLEIESAEGERQVLVRGEEGFTLEAPLSAPADRVASGELVRLLAGLSALRYVADEARPAHGLHTPWLRVRARFEANGKPEQVEVAIGAETEGGRFARIAGEDAVFVLAGAVVEQLAQPLVSRDLLAVPLERLSRATIERAGKRAVLTRQGEAFALDGEVSPRARALAEALATLRAAEVTGYGPPDPAHGLARPAASIAIELQDGTQRELRIGAARDDGARHARSSAHEVGFTLPAAQVDPLLLP